MIEVRAASIKDRDGIKSLWDICFEDSAEFKDWFFRERYLPEYSACLVEDGVIMSAMQACPLHVHMRGRTIPALMLAGVSTHPSRGGMGYMRMVFSKFMRIARQAGFPVVIHTPANIPTFRTRGHLPSTDTLHLTLTSASFPQIPDGISIHPMNEGLTSLHKCYNMVSRKYSGCVSRSIADFRYKFADYMSDSGKCMVFEDGAGIKGYCVYYALKDRLHAEECIATDGFALNALIEALAHEADGRLLHAKLPPDSKVYFPGVKTELKPQGVMGIADVSALLKAVLGRAEYVFDIADNTVPANAGIFDGFGQKTGRSPHIRLDAGRLAQLLCGYHSIHELVPDIEIIDEKAAVALDGLLPKETCFIVDEY